jgi:putative ABC transport system ATP-binding protein
MSNIVAENLLKTYGRGDSAVTAISEVSFTINSGEFVGVMGESGAGKSTLLSIMGAMNSPTSGSYRVEDIDVYGLPQERQADFRREFLGFVFQSFHLVPYLTVVENVMLPLTIVRASRKEKRRMADDALARVGLDGKQTRLPSQISGGEKERVAVARAIVNDPPVLLADEPTGNLDARNTRDVMALLAELNRSGMTVVMVTHSAECAEYAGRILRVADGRIVAGPGGGTARRENMNRVDSPVKMAAAS